MRGKNFICFLDVNSFIYAISKIASKNNLLTVSSDAYFYTFCISYFIYQSPIIQKPPPRPNQISSSTSYYSLRNKNEMYFHFWDILFFPHKWLQKNLKKFNFFLFKSPFLFFGSFILIASVKEHGKERNQR